MAGIGNVQLGVNLTGNDIHNMRLGRTATGMSTPQGGFLWDPTTRSILKREETDKQNDDNLTFLFEYRALLSSRVQTLITQLSNALASDLDVAMNATNSVAFPDKPAMNGNSTNTAQDAGAARTMYNYLLGWYTTTNFAAADFAAPLQSPGTAISPPTKTFDGTGGTPQMIVRGTHGIVTADGGKVADTLQIGQLYSANPSFSYSNTLTALDNRLDDSFTGPLGQAAINAGAKNLFEKVLFDAISSIEYKAVLSSGLFKNLVVAASSSLPTGSQLQASFNLNYHGSQDAGFLTIELDKCTAFYHS